MKTSRLIKWVFVGAVLGVVVGAEGGSTHAGAPNIQIDVPDGPDKKSSPGARFGKTRLGSDHSSNRPGGFTLGASARNKGWWNRVAGRGSSDVPDASAPRDRGRRVRADVRERTADLTPHGRANVR